MCVISVQDVRDVSSFVLDPVAIYADSCFAL